MINEIDELSEWKVKSVHSLILKEIGNANAGKYRKENVLLSGAKYIPPRHYKINVLMQELMKEYKNEWCSYHPGIKLRYAWGVC